MTVSDILLDLNLLFFGFFVGLYAAQKIHPELNTPHLINLSSFLLVLICITSIAAILLSYSNK